MDSSAMQFLETLLETPSPSGFEGPVQVLVRERLAQFTEQVTTDVFGNVSAVTHPSGHPRLVLNAHSDEIGLMVQYISDDGFIFFQAIGAPAARRLESQRARILNARGPVAGVIARKRGNGRDSTPPPEVNMHDLWIDIGARDREEAASLVSVGDPVIIEGKLETLRNHCIASRAFDDKIGVFVIVETMRAIEKLPIAAAVYCDAAVQEESGSRGAKASTYTVNPQLGITVDVVETSDYPDTDKRRTGEIALGRGPVLSTGPNFNAVLSTRLVDTARRHEIPYQFTGTPAPTWTDASVIQISRGGVATALAKIPLRYMHSISEIISLTDVEQAIELLTHFICELPADADFTPW